MAIPLATNPVSWRAFLTVLIFPAHIVLGLASVPTLLVQLARGSFAAWGFFLAYLPPYLLSAHKEVPGWKWSSLFRLFRVKETYSEYGGRFAVHTTEKFDPDQQYFIGVHPHGALCFGRIFWHDEDLIRLFNRDWRMLAASVLFRIPIIREMTLFFGAVDAGRPTVEKTLKAGHNLVLYPGALDEANSADAPDVISLRTRTGFIRIAVQHGIPLLPMFCFGELDVVSPVQLLPRVTANFLRKTLRMSSTVFVGRWGLPIPRRLPMDMVIGRPIPTQKCAEGSTLDAEVARVHAAFKSELCAIYEANKERFGYANRKLVFLCERDSSKSEKKSK